MATLTASAPPAPRRTFSFRRSFYITSSSKQQQVPRTSGDKCPDSERPHPKQRVSAPPPPLPTLPKVDLARTSSSDSIFRAKSDGGRQYTPAPPKRASPPIPEIQGPKSAPPSVQTFNLSSSDVSHPRSPTPLGKPHKEQRGHPHINVTKPPEQPSTATNQPKSRQQSPTTKAPTPTLLQPVPDPKPRSLSSTFVNFARRSLSPASSRSSSPVSRSSREDDASSFSLKSAASTPTTTPTRATFVHSADSSPDRSKPPLDRLASDSRLAARGARKSKKGFSMFLRANASTPDLVSTPTTARTPAKPVSPPPQRRFKDELWEPYRALENDLQRFLASKSDKTIIVRQFLLPFLERWTGRCPKDIAPEDLEKRVRTLHKWWMALLAQARARSSQYMSGAERPFYMDAMSAIMSRPEWRMAPSSFAPLLAKETLSTKSASSDSLSSASSGFSIQTAVQHNIKSLYSTAIYDTLAFVVEKMGYRTASPAVVAFGGKVIAYAFFFCNGVPEMLIHLWNLPPALVRRVLPEFGVGRNADMRDMSDLIVGEFPEALHCLGYCSFVQMLRLLRQQPKTPVGAVEIDWRGPWLSRWCGRDSDLVYVFLKHYHILMFDYLPASPSPGALICAPGYIPVLAQMSCLIDKIIRKQPGQQTETVSTTFEDLLNASATIPLTSKINTKVMAENALVILLQDILINNDCVPSCRAAFADSFMKLLRSLVRRTQRYDSNACFQLCELLEEVLPVLNEVQRMGRGDHVDWDFWFEVMNTMMAAENNMTELRVITFVYNIWDVLAESEERRKKWCLRWLLLESTWERFFYHWCPMVRAYYQRLVCWRIARHRGGDASVNGAIYGRLLALLNIGYKCHMKILEEGRQSSTAPCFPAPSRRLVILKNDPPASTPNVLLDFIPTSTASQRPKSTGPPTFAAIMEQQTQNTAEEDNFSIGKRWSQIRNAFGFKATVTETPADGNTSPPKTPNRSSTSSISSTTSEEVVLPPPPAASFKFSLEWMEHRMMGREQELRESRLPRTAQEFYDSLSEEYRPTEELLATISSNYITYVGRSLAEWRLIVIEHENFIDRRRKEGRPTDNDVETPTLGVDSMRKF